MKNWLIILPLFVSVAIDAQDADKIVQKGNDLYKQQQYDKAAAAYDEALSVDTANSIAKFNRANTAYRQAKPDDAIRAFDDLAFKSKEAADKARSSYNKGVVLSSQKKLEESIEAYKNALRYDPNDTDARENLQKALLELKKKTPPPKKEDKKKQQQNKKQQQKQMNQKEAEQNLKLLEQKEKELQERMQKQKSKSSNGGGKRDW